MQHHLIDFGFSLTNAFLKNAAALLVIATAPRVSLFWGTSLTDLVLPFSTEDTLTSPNVFGTGGGFLRDGRFLFVDFESTRRWMLRERAD